MPRVREDVAFGPANLGLRGRSVAAAGQSCAGHGGHGRVRRSAAAPSQLRSAPPRCGRDRPCDATGDPRPRRAILQPRSRVSARVRRHPARPRRHRADGHPRPAVRPRAVSNARSSSPTASSSPTDRPSMSSPTSCHAGPPARATLRIRSARHSCRRLANAPPGPRPTSDLPRRLPARWNHPTVKISGTGGDEPMSPHRSHVGLEGRAAGAGPSAHSPARAGPRRDRPPRPRHTRRDLRGGDPPICCGEPLHHLPQSRPARRARRGATGPSGRPHPDLPLGDTARARPPELYCVRSCQRRRPRRVPRLGRDPSPADTTSTSIWTGWYSAVAAPPAARPKDEGVVLRRCRVSRRFEELAWEPTGIGEVSLRRRQHPVTGIDIFEVKLGDEYLMSSLFTVAEIALADLALDWLGRRGTRADRLGRRRRRSRPGLHGGRRAGRRPGSSADRGGRAGTGDQLAPAASWSRWVVR